MGGGQILEYLNKFTHMGGGQIVEYLNKFTHMGGGQILEYLNKFTHMGGGQILEYLNKFTHMGRIDWRIPNSNCLESKGKTNKLSMSQNNRKVDVCVRQK